IRSPPSRAEGVSARLLSILTWGLAHPRPEVQARRWCDALHRSKSVLNSPWLPARASRRGRLAIPHVERFERLADPGALVLGRLVAAALHQLVGVLVPGTVGEIVPEHGGSGLRLHRDSERHVAFSQSLKRLLDMPRALILGDDHLETIDRAGEILLLQ